MVRSGSYHLFISGNHFCGEERLGASASATTEKGFGNTHCPFSHLLSSTGFLVCELVNDRTFTYVTDMNHGKTGWLCPACSWGKELVLPWWRNASGESVGVGFGERKSGSDMSSIRNSKLSPAFGRLDFIFLLKFNPFAE